MKFFAFLMMITLMTFSSLAQIKKNNFLISGGLSFTRNSSSSNTTVGQIKSHSNGFAFSPKVGLFISDKIALGIELPMNASSTKIIEPDGTNITSKGFGVGIGPFARYYCPIKSKLFFLVEAGTNYMRLNSSTGDVTNRSVTNQNIWTSHGGVGLAYLLSNNVSADFIVSYRHQTGGNLNQVNDALAAQVGLQIFLARKKTD
jgi:outer membrane protein